MSWPAKESSSGMEYNTDIDRWVPKEAVKGNKTKKGRAVQKTIDKHSTKLKQWTKKN